MALLNQERFLLTRRKYWHISKKTREVEDFFGISDVV